MNFYITPGAKSFLQEEELGTLVARFVNKDWGETSEDSVQMNIEAAETKDQIFAKYVVRNQDLFIITDYGHEVTTVLLAEDY
jgi:hypothetical protein